MQKKRINKINEFVTVKQASIHLGVSIETLRNWDKKKYLIAHRHPVNNYRLYKKDELDKILQTLNGK